MRDKDAGYQITGTVVIPRSEVRFRFSRSSGPGGQNVNRVATRVELLFDVPHSPSLTPAQRGRILTALGSSVDRSGVLRLTSQETRSQLQNRQAVTARFCRLLQRALHVPRARRATRPSSAARERRLAAKRHRSRIKRDRTKSLTD